MTAIRIDGNVLAAKIRERIAVDVAALKARGITPGLAVVLVGEDPASQVYVRNKAAACAKVGIHSVIHRLAAETSEAELLSCIDALNNDATIHGILVQLPLPKQIAEKKVLEAVAVSKDVDGFRAENVGALMIGEPRLNRRYFSIGEQCYDLPPLQIAHDRSVTVAPSHGPVIDADDSQRIDPWQRSSPNDPKQRVVADRQHQPLGKTSRRPAAKRQPQMMDEMLQPRGPP